jgi:FKBP-type peptidyl-prolyl cis-trans isomerase FkpA
MKKLLILCSILVLGLSACKSDKTEPFDAAKQAAIDDAAIQAYIKANNITATKDASGLYYQVLTPGTGAYPTASSTVTVQYTGKLLNGTGFDSGTYTTGLATTSNVIEGWKVGIPHINTGGRLLLLTPSALGYGNKETGPIPANSVLVFSIDLTGIK